MSSAVSWLITGASVALMLVMWSYTVWRELAPQYQTLCQLANQVKLSREAASRGKGGPYEAGAAQAYQSSLAIYINAAEKYNARRKTPCRAFPAWLLGLRAPPDLPEEHDGVRLSDRHKLPEK